MSDFVGGTVMALIGLSIAAFLFALAFKVAAGS